MKILQSTFHCTIILLKINKKELKYIICDIIDMSQQYSMPNKMYIVFLSLKIIVFVIFYNNMLLT